MGFKTLLFLLASFLLLTSRVSSNDEEFLSEVAAYAKPPVSAPLTAPAPPAKVPVRAPATPPAQVPVKPPAPAPAPTFKTKIDCVPLCGERCKLHSRKRLCLRACFTCCDRCKCVPPGTYGNREKCGKCYTDMTTRGGRLKCP